MIRAQIDYDRLGAIIRELGATLARTTRSKALAEGGRLAVGLLDDQLRLVLQLQSDVGESYLIRESSRALVDYFAFDLGDGDVLVSGDPYRGGSHPDVLTFLSPVFVDGETVLFVAVRAAMIDLGGLVPGPVNALADETWQEAVRVSPLKLYRNGVLQRDLLRLLTRNSRAPRLLGADIDAIVRAMQGAGGRLAAFLAARGPSRVAASVDEQLQATRRQALADLSGLTPAATAARLPLDWPSADNLALAASWQADGAGVTLDFTGTSPAVTAPINITREHARGFALAAVFAEQLDALPLNDGLLETVRLLAPAGSLVAATLPVATGLSDAYTGHCITSLVEQGLLGRAGSASLSGPAPQLTLFAPLGSREEIVPLAIDPAFSTAASGWSAPVLAGRRTLPSAEIMERESGLRILARERDGAGGIAALVETLGTDWEAAGFAPPGAARLTLETPDGEIDLGRAVAAPVPVGARIRFVYPGQGAASDV